MNRIIFVTNAVFLTLCEAQREGGRTRPTSEGVDTVDGRTRPTSERVDTVDGRTRPTSEGIETVEKTKRDENNPARRWWEVNTSLTCY